MSVADAQNYIQPGILKKLLDSNLYSHFIGNLIENKLEDFQPGRDEPDYDYDSRY